MASDELRRCVRVDEMANVLRAQDRQAGKAGRQVLYMCTAPGRT